VKIKKFKAGIQDVDYVESFSVCLNEQDNGGEAVTLIVDVFDNKDGPPDNIYHNIRLQTQCYGTSRTEITLTIDLEILKYAIDKIICESKKGDV